MLAIILTLLISEASLAIFLSTAEIVIGGARYSAIFDNISIISNDQIVGIIMVIISLYCLYFFLQDKISSLFSEFNGLRELKFSAMITVCYWLVVC